MKNIASYTNAASADHPAAITAGNLCCPGNSAGVYAGRLND